MDVGRGFGVDTLARSEGVRGDSHKAGNAQSVPAISSTRNARGGAGVGGGESIRADQKSGLKLNT